MVKQEKQVKPTAKATVKSAPKSVSAKPTGKTAQVKYIPGMKPAPAGARP